MSAPENGYTRRGFLATGGATLAGVVGLASLEGGKQLRAADPATATPARQTPATDKPLKRIAAINTVYRMRSHAYHIAGRFIFGYDREGFHHQPPFKLVRMYNDQYPTDDLSRDLASEHGFEIADTVSAGPISSTSMACC